MKVKWKELNNFKNVKSGRYLVSNDGDVIDIFDNAILNKKIANKKHHPYYAVYLMHNDGKKRWVLMHQLVAFCFVKIPKKYDGETDLVPDHLDNDGLNNNYKNLQWKTRAENVSDAFKMGYIDYKCEKSNSTDIPNSDVEKICSYLEKGFSYDKILKLMHYKNNKKYRTLIVRIKNKIAWTEISKKYNIKDTISYNSEQRNIIIHIPEILKLIDDGLNNTEIARVIWGNEKIKSKAMTVSKIRNRSIYKNILEELEKDGSSSTIERIIEEKNFNE